MTQSKWPDNSPHFCAYCSQPKTRKELFTSFYWECDYCERHKRAVEKYALPTSLPEDSPYGSGIYTLPVSKYPIHLPPGFTVSTAKLATPPATHAYTVQRGSPLIQFQKAGDTVSINGAPPYTIPVDGYYQLDSAGRTIRL